MTLAAQLDAIREGAAKRIPAEARAVMGQATQDLRESGILDGVPKVGDALPAFSLRNSQGKEVSSGSLLAQGSLVLTVFRGSW
jgi:hypothetical protein